MIVDALLIRRCHFSEDRLDEAPATLAEVETYAPLTRSRALLLKWKQGKVAYERKELDRAVALLTEVAQSHRILENWIRLRNVLLLLADCEQARGNASVAIELARESLIGSSEATVHYRMGMTNLVAYHAAVGDFDSAAIAALKLLSLLRKIAPLVDLDSAFLINVATIGTVAGQHEDSLALDGYNTRFGRPINTHGAEAVAREKLMSLSSLRFDQASIDALRAIGTSWSRSDALDAAGRLLDRALAKDATCQDP